MFVWRSLIASVSFFWECSKYWMINWASWNNLANPGGKLTSVVPIDFWLLNSSSRLQNAIPGKTVCKVLLSTLPSWKSSFMSMLAEKKILQKCQIDVNSKATLVIRDMLSGDCTSICILFTYIKQSFYHNWKMEMPIFNDMQLHYDTILH